MEAQMVSINKETGKERHWIKTMFEYTEWVMRAKARGYKVEPTKCGIHFIAPENEKCEFKVYFA